MVRETQRFSHDEFRPFPPLMKIFTSFRGWTEAAAEAAAAGATREGAGAVERKESLCFRMTKRGKGC